MRYLLLSLFATFLMLAPAKAQQDFDYVFDYINYYETKSSELGEVYSRFRTQFGSSPVEVQQARMDSIIAAADALWKNYIKSMPAYKGDNSYADGYKAMIKYVRVDFKKDLLKRKDALFQAAPGASEEDLTEEQAEVFNYYKELILEYTNKVEEYKLSKTVLENNFSSESDAYVVAKILDVVEQFENNSLKKNISGPDSTLMNVSLFGIKGTYHSFADYSYIKFDFTNSTDKQRVYADYQFLAEKMNQGGDDYRYYQNGYSFGGQDAYFTTIENECASSFFTSTCDDPWIAHLTFWEGLYGGSAGCELKIRFKKPKSPESED